MFSRVQTVTFISLRRKGVVPMSDYEILIVVFTVLAIVVGILIEYIKK